MGKKIKLVLFVLTLLVSFMRLFSQDPQEEALVFTFKIDAVIDPRTNRITDLALDKAKELQADVVIIEMDTYGGAVNDADDIRTRVMDFDIPIHVFINKDAASAGALISIACDSIYMAPGANIGAATVVTQDGQAAPDKYQSYMRGIMRSTAEAKGRDPRIAEAMVDEEIEIDTITAKGEVITFSTSEAIQYGFCEGEVRSLQDIIEKELGIDSYRVEEFALSATEKIIRIFLNPVVSGILILIIIGGIYFELQTPGVGFPILASAVALALYFVPYYLNGLADNWEIIAFFIGVVLIAVEIFVIPGFGVAGISGILLSLSSLVLVMLNNDALDFSFVDGEEIVVSISTILAGMLGSIIVMVIGGVRLTQSNLFKRIALQEVQDTGEGFNVRMPGDVLEGKSGVAYTVLRPSGKVMIDNMIYYAYTRGEYIDKGQNIVVLEQVGNSLKVKAQATS